MRSGILIIVLAITFLTGCESEGNIFLPEGEYSGHFVRSTTDDVGTPSEVTLTFSGNTYAGGSYTPKYPAICWGTFSIEGDKITFNNSCPWTAEFDWTLILSGEYIINTDGDQIKFFRDYGGKQTDTYVLNKIN